ncbi:KpsF/GutQ family sugar-phosphate isomerase [Thiorhodospira sibirica]|uniref:KpsF/GutQ family sugar-phosphate isomerase n=1 Tax=Thiorhodospira sibirica TaxID=154347 RepID=UPI00022C5E04|nr:KpsF/GutQ family sugar-phosphate isomerase [Thiorhodospira sibirica]
MELHPDKVKSLALAVLEIESQAVRDLCSRIDDRFIDACRFMLACRGRIVVTGMGKSGHIANKIAATLASTGTPAFFVHPGEASHGDLGMITAGDVVLALSNSGETDELLAILPLMRRLGVPLICLTGNPQSTLAREASVNLDVSVAREACPLGLAPTSSTTASLAMGDALAIALLEARGFTAEDFARSHPGGRLGRRLLLHVSDIMHTGARIPKVAADAFLREVLVEITRQGLGIAVVTDATEQVLGVYTDGDLRRTLDRSIDIHQTAVASVMTRACQTARPEMLAAEALKIMEDQKINALPVVDAQGRLVGALNMHDLLRAGVV